MDIRCSNCYETVVLDENQKAFLKQMKESETPFAMLECPHCGLDFGVNPNTGIDDVERCIAWRSPIPRSHGFVTEIEEGVYGCSETGTIWRSEEGLFNAIEFIQQRYDHRKFCYSKIDNVWLPEENEPSDIDDLIDTE